LIIKVISQRFFSIKVEFYSASELVWQSNNSNLFYTDHVQVAPITKCSTVPITNTINTTQELNSRLGIGYAMVLGDFNPIHLSKWSAKLFGFKKHIIHGMCTK
jgi:hypothetical protein